MKILYVTTIGITMVFFKSLIKELIDEGNTVDIICNETDEKVPECYREWGCKVYHHSCSRSPLSKGNLDAIHEIKQVVTENKYDIVHCHTPIASVCARLACKDLRKSGLRVIYTAHGFHFYKGAPLLNWLVYYPLEKLCSYFTDVLITINQEDYELAKKRMKAKQVEYVPGVGIDVDKFRNTVVDRGTKRRELGIPEDAFLLFSVGELNKNKNHEVVVRALAEINNENIYYLIAGAGILEEKIKSLCYELNVSKYIQLLGYRNDVNVLLAISDAFVFPSFREGLSVSVMEALASGLPCIVSEIRGNKDLVTYKGGMLFNPHDINDCKEKIKNLLYANRSALSIHNANVARKYCVREINDLMKKVYYDESRLL